MSKNQMVPAIGTKLNPFNGDLISEWQKNNKGISLETEAVSFEISEELFRTLSDWNTYLKDHVPYYQEPQP